MQRFQDRVLALGPKKSLTIPIRWVLVASSEWEILKKIDN